MLGTELGAFGKNKNLEPTGCCLGSQTTELVSFIYIFFGSENVIDVFLLFVFAKCINI